MTKPAKCGHNLISNIHDIVGSRDLPHAFVIPIRGDDYAACTHDRFSNETGNVFGSNMVDRIQHILGQNFQKFGFCHPVPITVSVR